VESIVAAGQSVPGDLIIVTNEVGLGVVPPYTSGRAYRDLVGRANQIAARAADEVILMVSGIPVKVK
jgi:adenosylcobinamide kinase/adenosylcobinamide-phosphate guanylyltransferase